MADFFSQFQVHPPNDFNLGGFQPQGNAGGLITPGTATNTGGGFTLPSDNVRPGDGQYGGVLDPRLTTQPQPYQQGPGGPLPDWMQKDQNKVPMAGGWLGGGIGSISNGQVTSGPSYQDMAQMKSGAIEKPGDFYAPPAIAKGPNGGFIDPGTGQPYGGLANGLGQPMNPSQQSGMVLMQSPDGLHMQNVPQAHVAHYTGLGATQVNGQQLSGMTGSSYGGGNG